MHVCGDLPQPQMEPLAPSVEVWISNYWDSMMSCPIHFYEAVIILPDVT